MRPRNWAGWGSGPLVRRREGAHAMEVEIIYTNKRLYLHVARFSPFAHRTFGSSCVLLSSRIPLTARRLFLSVCASCLVDSCFDHLTTTTSLHYTLSCVISFAHKHNTCLVWIENHRWCVCVCVFSVLKINSHLTRFTHIHSLNPCMCVCLWFDIELWNFVECPCNSRISFFTIKNRWHTKKHTQNAIWGW